jgi:hypothetical protein
MKTVVLLALSMACFAQDKITITVQRGTVTKTATIEASQATEAMKALDFIVQTSCFPVCLYSSETDAIRKQLAAWFISQLAVTPGTAIKQAVDAAGVAQGVADKAKSDYVNAVNALPIQ